MGLDIFGSNSFFRNLSGLIFFFSDVNAYFCIRKITNQYENLEIFFLLFWMAIGFAACQDSSKHVYPRYDQFPETYNKSCVQEIGNDSVFFRYPYRIDIKDSLVILLDLHNDSHFLYAFTFPDWQPITPFGKRGEGPDEILSAERMRICSPDSIWVLDSNRAQITRWKVSVADKKRNGWKRFL